MSLKDKLKARHGDDPTDIDTSDAFGAPDLDLPLKPGEYAVEVVSDNTREEETSSGGEQMVLDLKVTGPKYSDRRFFPSFQIDCPTNRDYQEEELDRVFAIYDAAGEDGFPESAQDFIGLEFVVTTGLERNEYKGEVEYRPTLWDVRPVDDANPPKGPRPDDKQIDQWEEAIKLAKGEDDAGESTPTKQLDEDDLGF